MGRELLYSGLVAGMMCGCQSAQHPACCDDCVPSKTSSYCPTYWQLKDEYITEGTAIKCANDDLKGLNKSCGKMSSHFADGFRQAYVDLSMGRPALTPTVPPPKYWNAYYRSCAGLDDVSDWFAGYRLGLEHGQQGGVSKFNRIATSWQPGGYCDAGLTSGPAGSTLSGYAATPDSTPLATQPTVSAPPAASDLKLSPYPTMQGRYGGFTPAAYESKETTPSDR